TRTMSKAFALAGARVGYLVAHPAVVDAVRVVRLPYHLSAVTQAVASTALGHRAELLGQVALLRTERDALAAHLTERGHTTAPSDANFVMFETFTDRDSVFDALLQRDVLVRAVGPDGWLRVSVGTPDDNAAFRSALDEADPRCPTPPTPAAPQPTVPAPRPCRAPPGNPVSSSASTSTAPGRSTCPPPCPSSTTCSRRSAPTHAST